MSKYCDTCKNKNIFPSPCSKCRHTLNEEGEEIPTKYEPIKEIADKDKHLKGYIFDSLVYRYQLALEQRTEILARQYIWSEKFNNRTEAEAYVRQHENKRDLMAFINILEEAIGEHD